MTTKPKQVILVRTDLNMGVGKIASQVAHASMKVFFDRKTMDEHRMEIPLTDDMLSWVEGEFTKVILAVDSEDQLLVNYVNAQGAGLPCALIQDNGHTVFNGVKTFTTVAIGPANPDQINQITGHLKLLK